MFSLIFDLLLNLFFLMFSSILIIGLILFKTKKEQGKISCANSLKVIKSIPLLVNVFITVTLSKFLFETIKISYMLLDYFINS